MVIQCSHCQARFKLADDKIKTEGTKVRCAKCKEVFTVFPETGKAVEEIERPAPVVAPPQPAPETTEHEEFSFDISDITAPPVAAATVAATSTDGPGFSLDEPTSDIPPTPPASTETEPPPSFGFDSFEADTDAFSLDGVDQQSPAAPSPDTNDQAFDFSAQEITFDSPAFEPSPEVPAVKIDLPLPDDSFGFNEPDHVPDLSQSNTELPPAVGTGTEFGEFSFEENAAPPIFDTAPAGNSSEQTISGDLDFSIDTPVAPAQTEFDATANHGDIDLSNFTFGDTVPAPDTSSPPAPAEDPFNIGDNPFADSVVGNAPPSPPPPVEDPFSIGDNPFAGSVEGNATPVVVPPQPAMPPKDSRAEKNPPPPVEPSLPERKSLPAHSVAKAPVHVSRPSSKKKFDSGPIIKFVVLILFLTGGVAAYLNYEKLETGFRSLINRYLEKQAPTEAQGVIALNSVTYSVIDNSVEGGLVVIRGEAVNNYPVMRSSIQVKAILYGKNNTILKEQTAYCGNILNDATLTKSTIAKIRSSMENELGDSLTNMNIAPGKAIPFTVVFKGVPKDLVEFAVEVVGSKPGAE